MTNIQLRTVAKHWEGINQEVPLRPIKSEKDYQKATDALNELLDIVGSDENHPMSSILQVLGLFIHDYECSSVSLPQTTPADILRFFMKRDGLKQADLGKDVGGQSIVSAILAGKRELNLRQIRALSVRFKVPPSMFI